MLVGALDALEAQLDPVRFEEGASGGDGTLWVGSDSISVPISRQPLDADGFTALLTEALGFVSGHLARENAGGYGDLEVIALSGALGALDRQSAIVSGREQGDFVLRFSGDKVAIGVRLARQDGKLVAVEVFAGGPAERGGLRGGEEIVRIDDQDVQVLTLEEAVDRIRGSAGSVVRLAVRPTGEAGTTDLREIELIRGPVEIARTEARRLEDGVAYLRVRQISAGTSKEFYRKLQALGPVHSVVLDLRGNTGGSLREAESLVDLFLSEGTIFGVVDRNGRSLVRFATTEPATPSIASSLRIAVLVDHSTAAAAEIVAGALAPLPQVTTIGEKTSGSGLIQQVVELSPDKLLKLTVGQLQLSEDRAIEGLGLTPEISLFPVAPARLGALADRPEGALAYLARPSENAGEGDLALELAHTLVTQGEDKALRQFRQQATAQIEQVLGPSGITWRPSRSVTREQLPAALEVELRPPSTSTPAARLCVTNANPTSIPAAWVAIVRPQELGIPLLNLGTIDAGGSVCGNLEGAGSARPGLASSKVDLDVAVNSGPNSLHRQHLELEPDEHRPALEIEVVRRSPVQLAVTLTNRGCCSGGVALSVPGATRETDGIAEGAPRTFDLPLSGRPRFLELLLKGADASQRITIPIPEERATIIPPDLRFATDPANSRGLLVSSASAEGLVEGWVAVSTAGAPPQKAAYAAWHGSPDGALSAALEPGRNSVTTKVKTVSGVSILEVRYVNAE